MEIGFVWVEKMESLLDKSHPKKIEKGYVKSGFAKKLPTVGEGFLVVDKSRYFYTSDVTEILEETEDTITFRTLNSIYKVYKTK